MSGNINSKRLSTIEEDDEINKSNIIEENIDYNGLYYTLFGGYIDDQEQWQNIGVEEQLNRIRKILENKDINQLLDGGDSPLHMAMRCAGCDSNEQVIDQNRREQIINLLINELGANPDLLNNKGEKAIDLVKMESEKELFPHSFVGQESTFRSDKDVSTLSSMTFNEVVGMVPIDDINVGESVVDEDQYRKNPIEVNRTRELTTSNVILRDIYEILQEKGNGKSCKKAIEILKKNTNSLTANDINSPINDNGDTILHIASSKKRYKKLVKELLYHGADVNKDNLQGETALFSAVENGELQTTKALIKKMRMLK